MEIETVGSDPYGTESYRRLFDETMNDLDKAVSIERARLVLDPGTPLFVFSIAMKAAPGSKTIGDVATVRDDVGGAHVTIREERYAPSILKSLFDMFGRQRIVQQTRFDLNVTDAKETDVSPLPVSSGEEDVREMMAALWRTMPEGIKNRKTFVTGRIITVVATEEILRPEMIARGMEEHKLMGGDPRV